MPEENELFVSALALLASLATANDTVRAAMVREGAGGVLVTIATAQPSLPAHAAFDELAPLPTALRALGSLALCTHPEGLPVLCRDHHLIGALAALMRTHALNAEVRLALFALFTHLHMPLSERSVRVI